MRIEDWLGKNNELGISIWERKYRNNHETFDEWVDRISGGNEKLKKLILEKKFLPGGRILASRGLANKDGKKITYSNCYVVTPPKDNLESIFDCAKKLARTYSYGGGCGIDLSYLAPKGAKVRNAAKESSGAVSFMDLYSMVTGLISQNGRRGALMLSINVDHPDVEDFINIKQDLDRVTKANTSIKITKSFIDAVLNDSEYELSYTRSETGETITKTVKAKELFHQIAYNNWDMGEPGMLYWDRISNWNLLSGYDNFEYAGVNPCAEEPLPAGGSCLLGSLNLDAFVDEDGNFCFDDLGDAAFEATIALNEILDEGLPLHPLQEQRDCVRDWRQIGLGVMGIADMLIHMGVKYGSDESINICSDVAYCILNSAIYASTVLASLNHKTFPKYDYDKLCKSEFYQSNISDDNKKYIREYGLYNSQLLTIAPTGTLSTMLGISGGIEPIFANYYTRRTESLYGKDKEFKVYTPIVKAYMEQNNINDDAELPEYFVTSADIEPINRIRMQGIWQKYIDASISSTINLPNDATVEDVEDIYIKASLYGLKGITVFRSGCRRAGILTTDNTTSTDEDKSGNIEVELSPPRGFIIESSNDLVGKKRKLTTGCGSLHCLAFFDPVTGDLMETYLGKGSTGGCNNFMIGLSRMISLAARGGVGIDSIIDQLSSSGTCPSYAARSATKHDTSRGSCCPVAIGNALKEMWQEMQEDIDYSDIDTETKVVHNDNGTATITTKSTTTIQVKCPECGEVLIHDGGCDRCPSCGWSKCQ